MIKFNFTTYHLADTLLGSAERWLLEVVERGPEHDDKWDEQKEEKPGTALSLRTGEYEVPPFVDEMRSAHQLHETRKRDR